jgi:hypothetical protein
MSAEKYDALKEAINNGALLDASRKELQRFARITCLQGFHEHFPGPQGAQIAETIRLMLLVRISEQPQNQAKVIALAAIGVSFLALAMSSIQTLVAVGIIQTEESHRVAPAVSQPAIQSRPQTESPPTSKDK